MPVSVDSGIFKFRNRRDEQMKKLHQKQESQAQLHKLQEWIEQLGQGLNKADHNFEIKRKFINILDVIVLIGYFGTRCIIQ